MTLAVLEKELAAPLSKLLKKVAPLLAEGSFSDVGEREDFTEAIKMLENRHWVRISQIGGGEKVLSITADGFKEVERTSRRGIAAFL